MGIRAPYAKAYRKDCKSLDGWTGSSPTDSFTRQNFSLQNYAGRHVRIEAVSLLYEFGIEGMKLRSLWLKT